MIKTQKFQAVIILKKKPPTHKIQMSWLCIAIFSQYNYLDSHLCYPPMCFIQTEMMNLIKG